MAGAGLRRILLGSTFLASAAVVGPTVAQEVIELDQIIVQGEKTERDLQDTSTSVQVFTEKYIEESAIQDLDDILDQAANVTGRFGGEGFAIRGINNASVAGGGVSPLGTLYIDGSPISGFAVRTGIEELWDVNQVEILRGPQSTTQGRNTLAGAIIVTTNDPVYENTMKFRVGAGTQDSGSAATTINGVLIDDVLAFRLSADFQKTDGFNTNPTLGLRDQADSSNVTLRGKLRFDPTANFSNIFSLTYGVNKSGDDQVRADNPLSRQFLGNIRGFEDTDQLIASVDSTFTINENWYLKNIFTFNRAVYDRLDDSSVPLPADPGVFSRDNTTTTFTEEFRVHFESDTTRAHLGGYYANIDFDDASGGVTQFSDADILGFGVPAIILPLYSGLTLDQDRTFDREEENYAVFSEVTHDFNSFLTATAGLRYDVVKFSNISTDQRTLLTALPGPCPFPAIPLPDFCTPTNAALLALLNQPADPGSTATSDALLPTAGFTLNWTEDLSTSFFARRGYRSGGSGTSLVTFMPFQFDPEFVWNYEGALRSQWFDGKLTVNANGFFMSWDDQQVQVPGPGGPLDAVTTNAGKSELYGFEVEAFARPTPELQLRGSVGHVKTKFVEFISDGTDLSGNEFPNAPAWTAAGAARYDFPNGVYIQSSVNYRSRAFTDPQNNPGSFEEARTVVNAKVGWRNESWDVYAYSTNLFDERYISSASVGSTSAKVGDGRFVGVRVTLKN